MFRIVLFLVFIAVAAVGAAWIADQPGSIVLVWKDYKISAALPVFVLALGILAVTTILLWSVLTSLWRAPGRFRRRRHERRHARGRHAVTQGLLAIGHGDGATARRHAGVARRLAAQDPLTLLLHAQTAQLEGDRAGAKAAFQAMVEREDTRLLGLRGLFIEAQRGDDPVRAVMIAEEALKLAPSANWASQAVLGFRCGNSDWDGALKILDSNLASRQIDKPTYRRQRGVLLTARALELETSNRDLSRASVMEAVKLAPTLVPAAVLAAKFESEAHQVRRAMRIVEAAWVAQPHPDLADAYAHVRLGDAARQRLSRVEALAAKTPGHVEGALAVARAAIDAVEFRRAREVLQPLIADPTQRVAMLMAELERAEHGDSGKARVWTLRAVRARHDPAWTADGYVSDRWRPVSPVTGRLDAFQWQTPVASLPSDRGKTIESSAFEEAMLAASPPRRVTGGRDDGAEASADRPATAPVPTATAVEPAHGANAPAAIQDNLPGAGKSEEGKSQAGRSEAEMASKSRSRATDTPAEPAIAPAESPTPAPVNETASARLFFRVRPEPTKPDMPKAEVATSGTPASQPSAVEAEAPRPELVAHKADAVAADSTPAAAEPPAAPAEASAPAPEPAPARKLFFRVRPAPAKSGVTKAELAPSDTPALQLPAVEPAGLRPEPVPAKADDKVADSLPAVTESPVPSAEAPAPEPASEPKLFFRSRPAKASDAARSASVAAETAKPDAIEPDAATDAMKGETAKPDLDQPDTDQPEVGKPRPTKSDRVQPSLVAAPPVIPLVRPPDDPGVDEEAPSDEFAEQIGAAKADPNGWRGFWTRLGG